MEIDAPVPIPALGSGPSPPGGDITECETIQCITRSTWVGRAHRGVRAQTHRTASQTPQRHRNSPELDACIRGLQGTKYSTKYSSVPLYPCTLGWAKCHVVRAIHMVYGKGATYTLQVRAHAKGNVRAMPCAKCICPCVGHIH